MLANGFFQWLSGLWAQPTPLKRLIDVNGTTLSLNQAVKITGTITAMSQTDTHFGCVQVTVSNPNGIGSPGYGLVISVDPSNLIVGS